MNCFNLYSVRDRLADNFRSVVLDVNDETAKRNFAYGVNNTPELLFQSKDLELYCVGRFEDHTGVLVPEIPLRLVCRGDEVIQHDSQ